MTTPFVIFQLLLAAALVRFVPMRLWRGYLGSLAEASPPASHSLDETTLRFVRRRAWHVARAANYFPFTVKCLPQAMVLQWQLRRRRIDSQLVIAMLKAGRSATADPYHAWVELGDIMVLGNCERSDYAVLMTLTTPPA